MVRRGYSKLSDQRRSSGFSYLCTFAKALPILFLLSIINGCASEMVKNADDIMSYQESLVQQGPQKRTGTEGVELISPLPDTELPGLEEIKDSTGKKTINLTLDNAVARALISSTDITSVSFDPSISKESISVEASRFDFTAFGQLEYDKTDALSDDISQSSQFHSSLWEAGIKKKGVTGAEWRLSYALNRSVDESINRRFTTAYEPTITFELKQPLLRDAWPEINLAGLNISKLNYKAALAAFREKAEEVSAEAISLYWRLLQARRDVEIQKDMLEKTIETLRKVEDRKEIDATMGDIKQVEASVKSREATLFEAEKRQSDVQDRLVRLLADYRMSLIDELEIIPSSVPDEEITDFNQPELIELALNNNPKIHQAQLKVDVAEINVKVAKKQKMPRLDLFGSTQLQGLSDTQGEAHDLISDHDYVSYTLGLTFEYPFGNSEKEAEFRQRDLQHSKAISNLQNLSDQISTLVKERIRDAVRSQKEIQVWKDAVNASMIHLQTLDDVERVRKKLTPEFLLTKIQAQDALARAQRSEIKAVVEYNIAKTRLAQTTGTILDLRYVKFPHKTADHESVKEARAPQN